MAVFFHTYLTIQKIIYLFFICTEINQPEFQIFVISILNSEMMEKDGLNPYRVSFFGVLLKTFLLFLFF